MKPARPVISPRLLAEACVLAFRPTIGARGALPELGVFYDPRVEHAPDLPLLLVSGYLDIVAWQIGPADPEILAFVFDRATYRMLHEGTSERDALLHEGHYYGIEAVTDGYRPVARAVLW